MDLFANFFFLAAIFDGLLRQLSKPSLNNYRRASVGKFSWQILERQGESVQGRKRELIRVLFFFSFKADHIGLPASTDFDIKMHR